MQLTLSQTTLGQSLTVLQRAIPSKPTLPILSSVLLTAEANQLIISATDLYVGIKTSIPCQVTEPGSCAVPGRVFVETVGQLDSGELSLIASPQELQIQTKSGTTKLPSQPAEDFPAFPQVEGHSLEVSTEVFEDVLAQVAFAASSDITRPILTSLLWQFSPDGLKVVGTDGFRLSVWESAEISVSETVSLLLPAKALQEVGKIASLQKAERLTLVVSSELKQVLCQVGDTSVLIRLLDGEYPPYQKIIPNNITTQIEFDTAEMIAHLKRAMIFARESSNIVQWHITPEFCTISATSATSGTHEGRLPITNQEQSSSEIAFNVRYVLDFLQACGSERVWFGMVESLKPAIFKPLDKPTSQYVVMPFRVQN